MYEVQVCGCGKTAEDAAATKECFYVYEGGASCATCLAKEAAA